MSRAEDRKMSLQVLTGSFVGYLQLEKTDREFMHKRDMFSEYVEAAARFKCLIKDGHVATVPKYVPRALRPQTPGRKWYAPVMKLPPGYKESGQATTPATPPAK